MAETVEMAEIRGLDIDKTVKGFALIEYTFKNDCTVTSTSADQIRWYQETSTDLTATAPSVVANVSPLAVFPTLEPSWTRQTSYVRKYAAEGFISLEDMKSSDIDVVARTLLRLTRAVVKQVDTRIYNVMSESGTPVNIQTFAAGSTQSAGGWNQISGAIIADLAHAKKLLADYGYNPEGATLIIHPTEYEYMLHWLIDTKGSSIPAFSSEKVRSGVCMNIMGLNVKVSPNATTDKAMVIVPGQACTWKNYQDTTAVTITDPGLGNKFRVWEIGEAILTDPKSVIWITNTTV